MAVSGGTQPNDTVEVLTPGSDGYHAISDSDASMITFYGTSNGVIKVIESVTGTFVVYDEDKHNFNSSVTLPAGTYTFECWGGQGNNAYHKTYVSQYNTNMRTTNGGYGGYIKGTITFNNNTPVFIHVGLGGETYEYNGMASTPQLNVDNACWVMTSTNESWNDMLICAGGGGCAMFGCYTGATSYSYANGGRACKQSEIPSGITRKLYGANETTRNDGNYFWHNGGGGCGYYGGGAGVFKTYTNAITVESVSGGGYNYISNSMIKNDEKHGGETFLSPEGVTETGHHGSACVRITGTAYLTKTYEILSASSRQDVAVPYVANLTSEFIGDTDKTRKIHVNEVVGNSTTRLQNITNICSHKPTGNITSFIDQAQQCNYKFTTGKHYLDSNIDKYGDVYFKDSGNWITSKKGTYIKRNGDWAKSKSVYVKENGFWKTMMPNSVTINFSLDGEDIEPIVSYMGCTIVPPNNGGAITWRDDDDNDVTNGYRIDSAVDSITLYGSVER